MSLVTELRYHRFSERTDSKPWILERTLDELKAELHAAGFPAFTARQVFQWLYHKNNQDPTSWSNVARDGREKLAGLYEMALRPVLDRQGDEHGTRKFLIGLADGQKIETVLIPEKGHYTFCLSSQVGCALACAFCATGTMGFRRNLTAGEIVSQVLTLKKELGDYDGRINLVFMGMGEPLLNYDNLARALRIICADGRAECFAPPCHRVHGRHPGKPGKTGARFSPGQDRLFAERPRPAAARRADARFPARKPGWPAGLFSRQKSAASASPSSMCCCAGVNDSPAQARQLARLLHGIPAKVNLIPYNANPRLPFRRPDEAAIEKFRAVLLEKGLTVVTRWSKGEEIRSACGQLAVVS